MANWNNPTLASLYANFVQEVKDRDVDAITMSPGTNIPVNSKRWDGASNTFQNWTGAVWNSLVVALAGGGTGSNTAAGARTNLGLGTMAVQNSNAVAITGGTIAGVSLSGTDINTGIVALARGGTGSSLVAAAVGWVLQMNPAGTAVAFGTAGGALTGLNASQVTVGNLPIAVFPTGGDWVTTTPLRFNATSYLQIFNGGRLVVGPIADMGAGSINAQSIFINGVPLATGAGIPTGLIAHFETACPGGWARVGAADNRVIRNTPFGGYGTGGADTHNHPVNITSGGVSDPFTTNATMAGSNRSFDSGGSFSGFLPNNSFSHQHQHVHSHDVNGNSGDASSWPPWIEFVLCIKL